LANPAPARGGGRLGPGTEDKTQLASTEPFLWRGGNVGCLLVHGFTGTPFAMRFLGERLHASGYTVHAVQLAGHATRVEELEACQWHDWYRSVEEGVDTLAQHCQTQVAIGQSLGSLLALRLAYLRSQTVAALVLLSSAFILANPWPARLSGLFRVALPFLPSRFRYVRKSNGGSDIADPEARRVNPGYAEMPLRGVIELLRLQREVRPLLTQIMQPALAIHGRQDHTAPLENLALLQQTLPSLRATVVLPESYHVVSVDVEKQRIAEEILGFLGALGAGSKTDRQVDGRRL